MALAIASEDQFETVELPLCRYAGDAQAGNDTSEPDTRPVEEARLWWLAQMGDLPPAAERLAGIVKNLDEDDPLPRGPDELDRLAGLLQVVLEVAPTTAEVFSSSDGGVTVRWGTRGGWKLAVTVRHDDPDAHFFAVNVPKKAKLSQLVPVSDGFQAELFTTVQTCT